MNLNDIYKKEHNVSMINYVINSKKELEQVIFKGKCVYVDANYLILLYNDNKLKIFTKQENNKTSQLDMTLLTLEKLHGWTVE